MHIADKAEALEAIELAAVLAVGPLSDALDAALALSGLERLKGLRAALRIVPKSAEEAFADAGPRAILGRALAVLARPQAIVS